MRHYIALITQEGEGAPVANVQDNSLCGEPVWVRDGGGSFSVHLEGAFPEGTIYQVTGCGTDGDSRIFNMVRSSPDYLVLNVFFDAVTQADGFVASVCITVYD